MKKQIELEKYKIQLLEEQIRQKKRNNPKALQKFRSILQAQYQMAKVHSENQLILLQEQINQSLEQEKNIYFKNFQYLIQNQQLEKRKQQIKKLQQQMERDMIENVEDQIRMEKETQKVNLIRQIEQEEKFIQYLNNKKVLDQWFWKQNQIILNQINNLQRTIQLEKEKFKTFQQFTKQQAQKNYLNPNKQKLISQNNILNFLQLQSQHLFQKQRAIRQYRSLSQSFIIKKQQEDQALMKIKKNKQKLSEVYKILIKHDDVIHNKLKEYLYESLEVQDKDIYQKIKETPVPRKKSRSLFQGKQNINKQNNIINRTINMFKKQFIYDQLITKYKFY